MTFGNLRAAHRARTSPLQVAHHWQNQKALTPTRILYVVGTARYSKVPEDMIFEKRAGDSGFDGAHTQSVIMHRSGIDDSIKNHENRTGLLTRPTSRRVTKRENSNCIR